MWRSDDGISKVVAGKRLVILAATLLMAAVAAPAQQNPADAGALPLAGQAVSLRTGRPARRVVVSIPDRKLAVTEDGRVLKTYRVAVGAEDSPSPIGEFKIAQRLTNPTYYQPGVVIPPGKDNPLGPRWLGLGQDGFGIHGTNQPRSVGRAASHGCIRLRNRDIEELFELVRVGDVVELHGERDEEVAQIFGGQPAARVARVSADSPTAPAALAGAAGSSN